MPRPIIGLALALLGLATISAAAQPASPARDTGAMERAVVSRINEIRRVQGRPPLRVDATLSRVAREYACWLSTRQTLTHEGPAGQTVADRVRTAGQPFREVGENLASNVNVPDPVATAIDGWMTSEGHRDNVLRGAFTRTGVGICRRGRAYYFTQVFLRPA